MNAKTQRDIREEEKIEAMKTVFREKMREMTWLDLCGNFNRIGKAEAALVQRQTNRYRQEQEKAKKRK